MNNPLPIVQSESDAGACSTSAIPSQNANGNIVSRYLDDLGQRQPTGPLAKAPLPMSM